MRAVAVSLLVLLASVTLAANDLSNIPLKVDTASSGTPVWGAVGVPTSIQALRWTGCTAAGTVVVQDKAGHTVWAATCAVTNQTDQSLFEMPIQVKDGVYVTTISSGVLYIYLAPHQ